MTHDNEMVIALHDFTQDFYTGVRVTVVRVTWYRQFQH